MVCMNVCEVCSTYCLQSFDSTSVSSLFRLTTCLEELFGVERFTDEFLNVPSGQENDGHHSHQHPGEDEAESDAAVEQQSRRELR